MSVYNVNGNTVSDLYDSGGGAVSVAYDVNGNIVHSGGVLPVDYDDYTISQLYDLDVGNCQGIAVNNGVLFQFRSSYSLSNTVCLFNFATGADIQRDMSITASHGDSASFSNTYYADGDEFPLLYVTSDLTPCVIYVNRITRESATLVQTLKFPQTAGYYGAGAFDFYNDICYILAYKENNASSDDGGANTTIVSKWDLSNLTDNGDGSYTPTFISQYERSFIYVMQGLTYHDGYIWISSSGNGNHVYAMKPDTGVIDYSYDIGTGEAEGVDFVLDPATNRYYMVTGQQNGIYKKITFAAR